MNKPSHPVFVNRYFIILSLVTLISLSGCGESEQTRATPVKLAAKYLPPENKILMFVGQDNESVGGNQSLDGKQQWHSGYVDTIGKPAGITHYIYFSENKINPFGGKFDAGTVDGLNSTTNWAAGPMCLRCYLESNALKDMVIHLSISMEHDDEPAVAKGEYDHNIQELADLMKDYPQVPFLLRIGYEFEGSWNSYEPQWFIKAWRRIVDKLREQNINNFATVLASYWLNATPETWQTYWPGDDYVDWLGYSYWSNGTYTEDTLKFAREKGLPVFLAETTPRGFYLHKPGSELVWTDWFEHFFRHIEANKDVIKAVSYINANWNEQAMWHNRGWGNSRIQDNTELKQKWLEKMQEPLYVHTNDGVFEMIGFTSHQ